LHIWYTTNQHLLQAQLVLKFCVMQKPTNSPIQVQEGTRLPDWPCSLLLLLSHLSGHPPALLLLQLCIKATACAANCGSSSCRLRSSTAIRAVP
jgi:hypothetical protein